MIKHIVILANSKKYSERCIAGIEIQQRKDSWFILCNSDSAPKWIRPVSGSGHGEIATSIADQYNLLDVAELNIVRELPQGFQSENCLIHSIKS
ncbi:MAG: hypothetical protein R2865_02940 [Deinococcales bacterium]